MEQRSYASALLSTGSSKPKPTPPKQQPKAQEPKVEKSTPAKAEEKSEVTPVTPAPVLKLEGNDGGAFAPLTKEPIKVIARYAGQKAVCAVGLTCKANRDKFLAPNVWAAIRPEIRTKTPIIKFRLDVQEFEAELAEGGNEVEKHGKVQNVPLSNFKRESTHNQLAKNWVKTVAKAPVESAKVLGGGFSFEEKERDDKVNKVARVKDLSLVQRWLEAVNKLIGGSDHQEVSLGDGTANLYRVGRGGDVLQFKVGEQSHFFKLSDFSLELLTVASDYKSVLDGCAAYLKKQEDSLERNDVVFVRNFLKVSAVASEVRVLQSNLEGDRIPRSYLSNYFKSKKDTKRKYEEQLMVEYKNIREFILKNFPADFEAVKEQCHKQMENAEKEREEARRRRDEERQKQREQQRAKAEKNGKGQALDEEDETPKKVVTKVTKTVDKNGWVVEKKEMFVDGEKTVSEKEKQRAAAEKASKKQGKAKKAKTPVDEDVPTEYLETNPFSAILGVDDKVASIADDLYEKNLSKGKATIAAQEAKLKKNKKKPQQQSKSEPTSKSTTPTVTQTKPAKKDEKPKAKAAAEPKQNEKQVKQLARRSTQPKPESLLDNQLIQPVAISAFVVLLVAILYSFVFS
eukprot:TRINITY_DN11276_c0_g1_i1.p1 TRINITY_DN11276_c0_g1~~TRINITY_DN11276_c0_g1_i1.p1  ORF type:complete len:634 (-),score=224.70 TRINITY_DN11276_c0_g1_i1:28-1908(-)